MDNRSWSRTVPAPGGTLGARDVVNAESDGYTLTVAQTPEIAINPFFMKDAGYDPRKDLQAIALAGVVPLALVVPGNAPYSTMAEFVKFLRTTDQAVTFASAGIGTPGHLAGELLELDFDVTASFVGGERARQHLGQERRERTRIFDSQPGQVTDAAFWSAGGFQSAKDCFAQLHCCFVLRPLCCLLDCLTVLA